MNKTVKQIADEIGVSKQKVYRFITSNHINEAVRSGQCFTYDEAAQTMIISGLSAKHEAVRSTSEAHQKHISEAVNETVQDVVELLKNQIEEKDKQIARLQEALHAEQLLHADTKKLLPAHTENEPQQEGTTAPEKRPGLFARIFWGK